MKIILHILLKDLRRHWREIALFILVTTGWAWQQAHPFRWLWLDQKQILPILLFLLWLFTVVRVVQGEALVGDREFWPTRPYRWGHLLAAKALFLGLCLNIPLAAAQLYLLAEAGIPFHAGLIAGMFLLQLEFAFFCTFPAAVLAAVTGSLVQWVLVVVGLFLFAMVTSWLPWSKLPVTLLGAENTSSLLGGAIVVSALAFALVWQYARRRVWVARVALAGAVLFVPAIIALSPTQWVRSIAYPPPSSQIAAPLHLTFRNNEDGAREYTRINYRFNPQATIRIPISVSSASPIRSYRLREAASLWRATMVGIGSHPGRAKT